MSKNGLENIKEKFVSFDGASQINSQSVDVNYRLQNIDTEKSLESYTRNNKSQVKLANKRIQFLNNPSQESEPEDL